MTRALYLEDGKLELRKIPAPTPAPGEALVRVTLAGVCDTDLQLRAGYMDFTGVPGHEFVGIVEEAEDQSLIGQRVVGEINAACGDCERCRRGLGRHCATRSVLGILGRRGAHGELLTLPERNLHCVPPGVTNEQAVFAEPLAAACEILEQIHIRPDDRVVVLGDGKLGLLIAQVLALTGCELHLVGRHESKLALLKSRGVKAERVAPGESSQLPDAWADVAVECSGSSSGFAAARRLLRPRGSLVLKSTMKDSPEIWLAGIIIDEIRLIGSRCGPFGAALRLLERGLIDVAPLVAARLPLGPGAYELAAQRGVLKVLMELDQI